MFRAVAGDELVCESRAEAPGLRRRQRARIEGVGIAAAGKRVRITNGVLIGAGLDVTALERSDDRVELAWGAVHSPGEIEDAAFECLGSRRTFTAQHCAHFLER